MEHCESGDLQQELDTGKQYEEVVSLLSPCFLSFSFFFQELKKWLVHVGRGLLKLHSNNIIHRDIKPKNIFITKKKTYKVGLNVIVFFHSPILPIGDYGICRPKNVTMTVGVGTMYEGRYSVCFY
jgi:serine/threonine protein kinase